MRLEQLQYLIDIAQNHSFTQTAQRHFISPQAINKSMKQLEKEIDVTIFERQSSGISLTSSGQLVLAFAQKVLADFAQLNYELSTTRLQQENYVQAARTIHICTATALGNIIMPAILNILKKEACHLHINIIESTLQDMYTDLTDNKYDLGILSVNEALVHQLLHNEQLHCQTLVKDELIVCMKADSPYITFTFPNEQLLNKQIIFGINPVTEHRQYAIEETIFCGLSNAAFVKTLLLQEDVVAFMPQLIYRQLFRSKKFIAKSFQKENSVALLHCLLYHKKIDADLQKVIAIIEKYVQKL